MNFQRIDAGIGKDVQPSDPAVYSVSAYAWAKGVTPETVRVWIHAGTLPNGDRAERSGPKGRWRIIVL